MPEHETQPPFPKWAPKVGVVFAAITLLFLMALVVASLSGRSVQEDDKFLINFVLALGIACASAFLGGDAAAKGRLPLPFLNQHPIQFSATGGFAIFVIVFILGSWLHGVRDSQKNGDASNTVTILVHGEKGKDELVLPNRGIVKLIYGDAIIPEQINNEGEATFKQVPEHFFQSDTRVEILFQDPQGEPYRAIHHDSLYQLTTSKYIALAVKLYGLGQIRGIVKDFETGDPIEGARISVQGEETFSNQYGEYTLSIPEEKQRKFQSIRALKEGYHSFELDNVPIQTDNDIPILMKLKSQ